MPARRVGVEGTTRQVEDSYATPQAMRSASREREKEGTARQVEEIYATPPTQWGAELQPPPRAYEHQGYMPNQETT